MCVHKLVPLLWPLGSSQLATWVSWVTSSLASVIGTRDYEQVKILLKTRQATLLLFLSSVTIFFLSSKEARCPSALGSAKCPGVSQDPDRAHTARDDDGGARPQVQGEAS